mgnify:CR=1 FL=1
MCFWRNTLIFYANRPLVLYQISVVSARGPYHRMILPNHKILVMKRNAWILTCIPLLLLLLGVLLPRVLSAAMVASAPTAPLSQPSATEEPSDRSFTGVRLLPKRLRKTAQKDRLLSRNQLFMAAILGMVGAGILISHGVFPWLGALCLVGGFASLILALFRGKRTRNWLIALLTPVLAMGYYILFILCNLSA